MRQQITFLIILICSSTGCQFDGDEISTLARIRDTPKAMPRLTVASDSGFAPAVKQVTHVQADTDSESVATIDRSSISAAAVQPMANLETIESLAIAVNPAIAKVEAELAALQGKRLQVGLYPNPRVGINGDEINDTGSAGRYGIFYSQQVVQGNRLGLARKKVCAEINAKEIQLAELQQRLITDVRIAYYEMLVANRKIDLIRELVNISSKAVEATALLVEAQELAETATLQANVEWQKAELNLARAQNELTTARRRLAGFIDETDLPFESFSGTIDPDFQVIDIDTKFQGLLDSSPELNKLLAGVEVARRNLDHQCSLQIPDVTWQAGLAYDFGSDDWVPNFQVGVPIMKFNRNQGAIAQARNEIVAVEKATEQKALQLRQRLVASYQRYQDAVMQVDAIGKGILPAARKTLELVSLGFEQGEVSFLELLTAQRTFFTINLDYIEQLKILWRQSILIDGMMLDRNLDQFE